MSEEKEQIWLERSLNGLMSIKMTWVMLWTSQPKDLNIMMRHDEIFQSMQSDSPPSPCVTPLLALWSLPTYWEPSSSQDLKWTSNISGLIKKIRQRMYVLWQLKKFNLPVNDGALLHGHHWVHPCFLYHRCWGCQGQGQTAAYHLLCRKVKSSQVKFTYEADFIRQA